MILSDYAILNSLKEKKAIVPLRGITIQGLEMNIKHNTIYKRLNHLLSLNLINNGIKNGRANTYYITQDGLQILSKILKKECYSEK